MLSSFIGLIGLVAWISHLTVIAGGANSPKYVLVHILPLESRNYTYARQICQSLNRSLGIILNAEDQALVNDSIPPEKQLMKNNSFGAWIGLNDELEDGEYVWDNGLLLSETGYSNWFADTLPRNSALQCGFMYISPSRTARWDDGRCSDNRSYVLCDDRKPFVLTDVAADVIVSYTLNCTSDTCAKTLLNRCMSLTINFLMKKHVINSTYEIDKNINVVDYQTLLGVATVDTGEEILDALDTTEYEQMINKTTKGQVRVLNTQMVMRDEDERDNRDALTWNTTLTIITVSCSVFILILVGLIVWYFCYWRPNQLAKHVNKQSFTETITRKKT